MAIDPLKLQSYSTPAPEARFAVPERHPGDVVPDEPATSQAPDPVEAVKATSRRFAEMKERGRELHFEATETGLRIEVYDGLGRLVQAIPPNEAMAIANGRPTWRA